MSAMPTLVLQARSEAQCAEGKAAALGALECGGGEVVYLGETGEVTFLHKSLSRMRPMDRCTRTAASPVH